MSQEILPDGSTTKVDPIQSINPDIPDKGIPSREISTSTEIEDEKRQSVQNAIENSTMSETEWENAQKLSELRRELHRTQIELWKSEGFQKMSRLQKVSWFIQDIFGGLDRAFRDDPLAIPRIVAGLLTAGHTGGTILNRTINTISDQVEGRKLAENDPVNPLNLVVSPLNIEIKEIAIGDSTNEELKPAKVIEIPITEIAGNSFALNPRLEFTLIEKGDEETNAPKRILKKDILDTKTLLAQEFNQGNLTIFLDDGRLPQDRPKNSLPYDIQYFQEGDIDLELEVAIYQGGTIVFTNPDNQLQEIPIERRSVGSVEIESNFGNYVINEKN